MHPDDIAFFTLVGLSLIILSVVLCACGCSCPRFSLEVEEKSRKMTYEELANIFRSLYESYKKLQVDYKELQDKYKQLEPDHTELWKSYSRLDSEHVKPSAPELDEFKPSAPPPPYEKHYKNS